MAKRQTRRSVSLNRQAYERAAAAAEAEGTSLSKYTEDALEERIRIRQRAKAVAAESPPPARIADRTSDPVAKSELDELELAAFSGVSVEYDEAP